MSFHYFTAWEMDIENESWWKSEPQNVPRVTTTKTDRISRLQAIGNGQVPKTMMLAFIILSQGLLNYE